MTEPEFRTMLTRLRSTEDPFSKYGVPAFLLFQFHVIGRIDDCANLEHLKIHDTHKDKAAKMRLAWSKNVTEE